MIILEEIREACEQAKATINERFPYGFGSHEGTDRVRAAKIDEYNITLEIAESNLRDGRDVSDVLQFFLEEAPVRR